ncbi:MAG: Peptidase Ste24p [Pedosphaera sp.]|nr:Peptidase Ste24p [Pedosphaera sp.]
MIRLKKDASFYIAQAFNTSLGSEAIIGSIVCTQFTFRFESETADVEIPYNQLTFQLDEDGDERICFYHAEQPEWTICTADFEILTNRAFTTNSHLRHQVNVIFGRKAWRQAAITTVAFLAIFLAVICFASWGIGQMVRASVNHISPASEKELGDTFALEFKKQVPVSKDPKLMGQLNALYAQLRRGLPDTNMAVEFHVVEMDLPNAFSLPGHVFVTRGLFDLVDTPDEMAGVLSHELGHITEKHVFRQIISSQGPAYVLKTSLGDSHGTFATIAENSQMLLGLSFTREYEREADEAGWKCLVAANINPHGFIEVMQKFLDLETREKHAAGIASTHPPTEARVRNLEAHWEKLKQKSGFVDLSEAAH